MSQVAVSRQCLAGCSTNTKQAFLATAAYLGGYHGIFQAIRAYVVAVMFPSTWAVTDWA